MLVGVGVVSGLLMFVMIYVLMLICLCSVCVVIGSLSDECMLLLLIE